MIKDFEVIRSTMTCIHIIIGKNPEKEPVFNSIDDLLDSISKCLDHENNAANSGYYGKEILDSFLSNIEWMKAKGIVTSVRINGSNYDGPIRIDKKKLVKHIVNS